MIPSGSNYGGCAIAGVEYNEAVAFDVVFVKNSRLFWLFAVFFPLLSFSILFMVVFEKKWEETIGLSFILEVLMLYVFGLFNSLAMGISAIYVASIVSFVVAFVIFVRKQMTPKELFSPGIIIYGGLFILICINCRGAFFARWDEYIHWGLAAKDMFYYDSFAKHVDTTVRLIRYMPFSTLTEYLFVFLNGLFSQEIVYVAYQTLLLSLGCVMFYKAGNKKLLSLLAAVAVVVLVPVIFFTDIYNSIYVDALLAILTFYILYCYLSENMSVFNYLRISCGLMALVLTKDTGIAIAGLLILIMVADIVYRQIHLKMFEIRTYIVYCSFLAMIFVAFFSWQVFLSIPAKDTSVNDAATATETSTAVTSVGTVTASGLSVKGSIELLNGTAPEYRYKSIKNFLIKVFDGETFSLGNIKVPYMDFWIIFLVLMFLLTMKEYWGEKSKRVFFVSVMVVFGAVVYGCFLELLYMFAFPDYEALTLASHDRYLGSYLCGCLLPFVGLLLWEQSQTENDDRRKAVLICILGAVLIATPIKAFVMKHMDYEIIEDNVYYSDELAEVLRSFSKRGEKIFFVCNNTDGLAGCMFKNFASPLINQDNTYDFLGSKKSVELQKQIEIEKGEGGMYQEASVVPEKALREMLKDYDYVFILHPYDIFSQDFKEVFEEPQTVDDGTIYRVKKSAEGESVLGYIGKIGVKLWRLPEY